MSPLSLQTARMATSGLRVPAQRPLTDLRSLSKSTFFISSYGKGRGDDNCSLSFCLEDFQGPTILPLLGSFTAVNRRELAAPSLPVPLRDTLLCSAPRSTTDSWSAGRVWVCVSQPVCVIRGKVGRRDGREEMKGAGKRNRSCHKRFLHS